MKNIFNTAIKDKKKVKVKIYDKIEQSIKEITCIPFDISPPKKSPNEEDVFHLYNIDNPNHDYYFTVKPQDMTAIEITDESFDPLNS